MEGSYEQYGDTDVGYAAEIKLPRSLFSTKSLRVCPVIYNRDSKYETVTADTVSTTNLDDRTGWLKLNIA